MQVGSEGQIEGESRGETQWENPDEKRNIRVKEEKNMAGLSLLYLCSMLLTQLSTS